MFNIVIYALWFFLPAGVANAAPVFANKIPVLNRWNTPMDFHKKFKNKRIFGNNKTWRGFVVGISAGIIIALLQFYLYNNSATLQNHIPNFYDYLNPILFGFILGFGALTGDAVKSFFKRQKNVQSGLPWTPFDQIDYVIGGLFMAYLFTDITLIQALTIYIVWVIIHPIATVIGWLTKLKSSPL